MLADENLSGKGTLYNCENFPQSLKFFSKIGRKSETEGKCIMVSGGWTPLWASGVRRPAKMVE